MAGTYKTLGTSIILDLVANDNIVVFINAGLVWIDDSGNFNGYLIGNQNILSWRHCKPIPAILLAILLEIIPIKILYKISIKTHTII